MSDVAPTTACVDRATPSCLSALKGIVVGAGAVLLLAGCATQPQQHMALGGSKFDPRLGVSASERVVFGDDPVPRGGGSYLVGHPYVIGGRSYYPSERPKGYTVVGTASWYGDAFHGRRTANGEVFDRNSISAAHPTLPLPSYVRVTNLSNGRSMIVRVNDRGPYHGGRVMDVSQRVAETLDFRRAGTARIKVDYVGRASLSGDDDEKLLATLRTDGAPAMMAGLTDADTGDDATPANAPPSPRTPAPSRVARLNRPEDPPVAPAESKPPPRPEGRPVRSPLPPARPFETSQVTRAAAPLPPALGKDKRGDKLAALLRQH